MFFSGKVSKSLKRKGYTFRVDNSDKMYSPQFSVGELRGETPIKEDHESFYSIFATCVVGIC